MKSFKFRDQASEEPPRHTIFVGGPIQYAVATGAFDLGLRCLLENVLRTLSKANYRVLSAHLVEKFGVVDMTGLAPQVTRRDYEWMKEADAYVCLLPSIEPGLPYRSDGTCIELGWASAMEKPIVLVRSSDSTYTHLIEGLHAIANVTYLYAESVLANPSRVIEALETPT